MAAPERKPFLLRIPPELWQELEKWAADELRSVNGRHERRVLLTDPAQDALRSLNLQLRDRRVKGNGQENTKVEMMQNLQVMNSFCSFEIPDIFLFETRFKK